MCGSLREFGVSLRQGLGVVRPGLSNGKMSSHLADSNCPPADYESAAYALALHVNSGARCKPAIDYVLQAFEFFKKSFEGGYLPEYHFFH